MTTKVCSGGCVFCGRANLSKQHVFQGWLRRFEPPGIVGNLSASEHFDPSGKPDKVRQGSLNTRKVRCVCRSCNHGWIEKLESNVRPLLVSLFECRLATVGIEDQSKLAIWLAIVTCVVEYLDPPTAAIPEADRRWLKAQQKPPANWKIGIGRYTGEQHKHLYARHYSQIRGLNAILSGDRKPNTQSTTLVVGSLCANIVSSVYAPAAWGFEGGPLLQLWPIEAEIEWDAAPEICDLQLTKIAETVARSGTIISP
jgi:hypothetical protein